jgi:hypothetical protein
MEDSMATFVGVLLYYALFCGLALGIGAYFYIQSWREARKK